ncbi:MAG: SAM-dependent methyltransferase [Gammaproteobacteria bacterium]|nr:SAM-dependent methyltransferase [Gammaproteobacteria bacterium]
MSSAWYSDLVDSAARSHSEKMAEKIRQEIQEKGLMGFSRFMELALYAPGLGYYCVGTEKIGRRGDFVTAPEISPLFSQCLAGYCQKVLSTYKDKTILELGAGTGRLAAGILKTLAQMDCLPDQYLILDVSPELQERQKKLIGEIAPEQLSRVDWLESLPESSLDGVIIANEVLDAMPVSIFQKSSEGYLERVVGLNDNNEFIWKIRPASEKLSVELQKLDIEFPLYYYSEINLNVDPWICSLDKALHQGEIIIIDYGFLREEYYHPQRNTGTLMCHFQQRAHPDPLILAGIQDITAHVDFTAVGKAAEALSLKVKRYSTQAEFLLKNGLLDLMQKTATTPEQQFILANQVKMLTLPSEMGELFKVMILEKDCRK